MRILSVCLFFFTMVMFAFFIQSCKKKENVNVIRCDTAGWSPDSITYSKTVAPIIAKNCIRCHSNTVKKGWVDLEGYERVKKYADNHKLLGCIAHLGGFKSMPRGEGATKLPQEEICEIKFWIDNGARNN